MLNPNPSPHSDPDVLTRFHEELARGGRYARSLAPAGAALGPRFAGYYQDSRACRAGCGAPYSGGGAARSGASSASAPSTPQPMTGE